MKHTLKKSLAIILAAATILCCAPLSGIADIDLPEFGGFKKFADSVSDFFDGFAPKAEAATSGTCGDNLTWNLNKSTGTLTISGSGKMYDYSYDSGPKWRYSTNYIQKIIVGDEVTYISDYAFYDCDKATDISIGTAVTGIGDYSFGSCSKLSDITIPNSVKTIGDYAFVSCSNLTKIVIGNGVESIGEYVFWYCDSLEEITIPDNVTEIGEYAFWGCDNLSSVTIGEGLTEIKERTFDSCPILETVIIGNSVTRIGEYSFGYCEKLTNVTIGNGVTDIAEGAFINCSNLTDISFPESVATIGDFAFYECIGLTKLILGNGVKSIGSHAFGYCKSVSSIKIPGGVTSIGDRAFAFCDNLSSISVDKSNAKFFNDGYGVLFERNRYVAGNVHLVQYPIGNPRTSYNIPDGTRDIDGNAFEGCKNLNKISIPDSVDYFGGLSDADSLTFISFNNSNKNYSNDANGVAFNKDKTVLIQYPVGKTQKSYTIPNTVIRIYGNAFYGCENITSITIPEGISNIEHGAFHSCSKLTSVTVSNSLTNVGSGAFYGCIELTDVYYNGTEAEWNAITIALNNEPLLNATIHFNSVPGGETLESGEKLKLVSTTPSDNSTILITDNDLIFNFDRRFTSINDGFEITINYDLNQKKITHENSNYKIEGSNLKIIDAFEGIPSQKQCYIKIKKFDAFDETKNVIYPFYGMASDEYIEVYLCDTIADSGYSQDHVIYDYSTRNEKYIDDKLDSLAVPMDGTNGNPDFCVPGQGEDMIPQGLAYYEEKNWLLISSYNKVEKGDEDKQRNSVIFALDYDTGDFVAQFNLLHDDKSPFKGHVGGIAVSDHNLYISRGSGVAYIPLSELDVPEGAVKEIAIAGKKNFAQLKKDEKEDTESASCSYVDCTDGVLWAGNFYSFSGSVVTFNEGWRIPASKNYNSVLLGFKLSGNTPEEEWKSINRKSADYYVGIPNSVDCIQGVAAKEIGNEKYQVFLSRTTGASFTTTISAITFDFIRNKTAYPKKKNFVEINNLPGAENLVINDGGLYCVYESAALDEYGKLLWNENVKDTTDVVWRFDLSQILSIERYLQMFNCPIDIEVYEKDSGKLVGRTVNNVVDEALEDKNVVVEVYGETKYLWTPANKEYIVKIIGNGEGKMDYSVIKYGSNLEETERTNFYDISITEGKEIVGELSAENFDLSQYKLMTGNETIYPSDSFKNSEHHVMVNVISDIDGAVTESIEAVAGDFVTVHASDVNGLIFAGWYIDNKAVSSEKEYGFVIKQDTNITAKYLKMSIREPSTTAINYGDSIILHANISGELSVGYTIEWTASNGNFSYKANGATCTISPEKSGDTVFTATIYDANGNAVSTDEQTMTSKAGFFQKIIAFFKKLFGLTKTYPDIFGI